MTKLFALLAAISLVAAPAFASEEKAAAPAKVEAKKEEAKEAAPAAGEEKKDEKKAEEKKAH